MGHITSYPYLLKQLDLSYNNISTWFDLPSIDAIEPQVTCYSCEQQKPPKVLGNQNPGCGQRNVLLNYLCTHRRHLKLDNLRTLIIANNCIEKIQLVLEKDYSEGEENHSVMIFIEGLVKIF